MEQLYFFPTNSFPFVCSPVPMLCAKGQTSVLLIQKHTHLQNIVFTEGHGKLQRPDLGESLEEPKNVFNFIKDL